MKHTDQSYLNHAQECIFCKSSTKIEVEREAFDYITPKGTVVLYADIPYQVCQGCDYRTFGPEGERAHTAAIYCFHKRLPPWEVSAIREKLCLSQLEFSSLLNVGHASIERWETGETMQNASMDNLIILMSNPDHQRWLEAEKRRIFENEAKSGAVVSIDSFRALRINEISESNERSLKFRLRL